jgi:putative transposase
MPKPFYRRNLPHLQRDAKSHFLTFCTYQRWILPGWARDIVLSTCIQADQRTVNLLGVVVMPDHVHMIFVPEIDTQKNEVFSLSRITQAIKGASAHLINQAMGKTGRVWQEESFDRVLRCSEKVDEKIQYIVNNPVRKGLASRPEEYVWTWLPSAFAGLQPSFARPGR